ncbi:hypothetical protein [Synergistes jonesii]|nr:hypothetical protein [Synergistes jonesii]
MGERNSHNCEIRGRGGSGRSGETLPEKTRDGEPSKKVAGGKCTAIKVV